MSIDVENCGNTMMYDIAIFHTVVLLALCSSSMAVSIINITMYRIVISSLLLILSAHAQQQNPMTMNGGTFSTFAHHTDSSAAQHMQVTSC
jgi:hypothetical protein